MEIKFKGKTQELVMIGIFAAILVVLSQISIPLPSGVPVTMQTFAVILCGYVLGARLGAISVIVYIALGAIGLPVYAGFSGGIGALIGPAGGFFWGFIIMAVICGFAIKSKNKVFVIILGCISIIPCHLLGIIQFSLVTNQGFGASFLIASAPFLIKDVVSAVGAYFVALAISKALLRSKLAKTTEMKKI